VWVKALDASYCQPAVLFSSIPPMFSVNHESACHQRRLSCSNVNSMARKNRTSQYGNMLVGESSHLEGDMDGVNP